MSRFRFIFFILISLFAFNAFAQTEQVTTTTTTTSADGKVIERREIVTTTPAPKEVLPIPTGFVSCFIVKAGWYQDVWIADHNVCTYSNSPNGMVWVEGYWACNKYDATEGKCTNWDWKSAHWEKTVTVY